MNASINSLLGPLEAATRSGSWEDAEDIAEEIRRLAKLQRLSELQKIHGALNERQSMYPRNWPKCPTCGEPALDGHTTCGLVSCREALWATNHS